MAGSGVQAYQISTPTTLPQGVVMTTGAATISSPQQIGEEAARKRELRLLKNRLVLPPVTELRLMKNRLVYRRLRIAIGDVTNAMYIVYSAVKMAHCILSLRCSNRWVLWLLRRWNFQSFMSLLSQPKIPYLVSEWNSGFEYRSESVPFAILSVVMCITLVTFSQD